MKLWSVSLVLLSTAILAGCIAPGSDYDGESIEASLVTDLLARKDPLWVAPQDFPHADWDWPTLTNPPANGSGMPKWWQPIEPAGLPDSVSGMEWFATTGNEVSTGRGSAFFGSLAVVPSSTTHIVDISDPANPVALSELERNTRGAAIIAYPDGRLVTVLATGSDVLVWDITDPENPEDLGGLGISGSHKVGVVPGTPIVYNAASRGGGGGLASYDPDTATGVTEIYDLTDPRDPEHVMDWNNGYSCHHVYFHNRPDEGIHRAVCAGVQVTQIWDTSDPRDPQVIANIPVHHGNPNLPHASVSIVLWTHFSILSNDGTILIVGDETGGGGLPGCDVYLEAGGQSLSGPIGNLWFYDVSDIENPQLMGWLNPTNPPVAKLLGEGSGSDNCTAHHGRLIPDPEGRDLLAMAFYGAGTVLVDFTDPMNPVIADQYNEGTNTWEVWYYNGYLFTGDMNTGMDVLRFV